RALRSVPTRRSSDLASRARGRWPDHRFGRPDHGAGLRKGRAAHWDQAGGLLPCRAVACLAGSPILGLWQDWKLWGISMSLTAAERDELTTQLRQRAVVSRKEVDSLRDEEADEAMDACAVGASGGGCFATGESLADACEAQRHGGELGAIQHALARIDEGSYVVCAECGADSPIERLC